MNHGRGAVARGGRVSRARRAGPSHRGVAGAALAVLFAAAAVSAGTPARAQVGITDLPRPEVDPRIDPAPFDPRLAIRDYLRVVLPTRWWFKEPEFSLGAWWVTIHVPDDWKGNPTSAVLRFCPPTYSVLWTKLDRIEFTPFYHDARWAGVTCRKG